MVQILTEARAIAKTEIEKGLTIIRWKEKRTDEAVADDDFHDGEEMHNYDNKIVDFAMTKASDMK